MISINKLASRVSHLPLFSRLSPSAAVVPSSDDLAGFIKAQRLAFSGAKAIANLVRPGWT